MICCIAPIKGALHPASNTRHGQPLRKRPWRRGLDQGQRRLKVAEIGHVVDIWGQDEFVRAVALAVHKLGHF